MAEHHSFFKVVESGADKLTEARHDAEKANKTNWDEALSPMASVRRRLERASTTQERKAIREQIEKMPDARTKMTQLLAHYKTKPKAKGDNHGFR